ncbi:MAG: hypothetical protein AB7P21_29700 [Lautropia sp.]
MSQFVWMTDASDLFPAHAPLLTIPLSARRIGEGADPFTRIGGLLAQAQRERLQRRVKSSAPA